MATAATQPRMHGLVGGDEEDEVKHGVVAMAREEASKQQVSRLAVQGGSVDVTKSSSEKLKDNDGEEVPHGSWGRATTTLPPPHAWLAVDDTTAAKNKSRHRDHPAPADEEAEEDQWARLLRGGGGGSRHYNHHHHHQAHRRSSFCVARREARAEREAWLDRAWEMKRSWHQRNGGAPDADTPVVVVLGGGDEEHGHHNHHNHAGGVAMDVEEVRACRDLGLELPSDCTVEIQCYGLSGDTSPTHSGADSSSPCGGGFSSPAGADPTDVKARLKVWAHAVALASTTQLGS